MESLAVPPPAPDRNLALELVRVTEAAAMAAGRWVGRGDKNGADAVAVNAMRVMISTIGMRSSRRIAMNMRGISGKWNAMWNSGSSGVPK